MKAAAPSNSVTGTFMTEMIPNLSALNVTVKRSKSQKQLMYTQSTVFVSIKNTKLSTVLAVMASGLVGTKTPEQNISKTVRDLKKMNLSLLS